jgi:hypothetical protein
VAITGRLDLTVFDGDDYSIELQFVDADGNPFDLTGHSFAAPIRHTAWADDPTFEFTIDDSSKATGLIVLSLTDDETPDVPKFGAWDLVDTVGSTTRTLLAGPIRLTRDSPVSLDTITVSITDEQVQVVATMVIGAAQLATETAARIAADAANAAAITTETTARAAGDTANAAAIATELARAQTAEALLIPLAQKAAANGVATLGADSKIPDAQIPATIARDTEIATAVAALVAGAPGALDTLDELAAALGDDANFAATVTNALAGKAATSYVDTQDAAGLAAAEAYTDDAVADLAAQPGAAIVTDSFERANNATTLGTADTGQTWVTDSGTWGILGGKAYVPAGGNDRSAVVDALTADCVVTATIEHGVETAIAATVTDTFTRADSATTMGNAETGQTWVPFIGTFGIASNKAYLVTSGSFRSNVITSGLADCTVEADITYSGTNGGDGIVFRAVDINNYLYVTLGTTFRLLKRNGTVLLASSADAATTGVTYNVKVRIEGAQIDVYLDDILKFTHVLSSADLATLGTATKHGIFASNQIAARYDNFVVSPLVAATPILDGLVMRRTAPTSYLRCGLGPVGLTLSKRVAGTYTELESAAYTFDSGVAYAVKATLNGSLVELSINGVVIISHSLTPGDQTTFGAATSHGLYNSANTTARFANIAISELPADAATPLNLDDMADVSSAGAIPGQVLTAQDDGTFAFSSISGTSSSVDEPNRFRLKASRGYEDPVLLVLGDSTGDADDEWVRLTATKLASTYPTHRVQYARWSSTTGSWAAYSTVNAPAGWTRAPSGSSTRRWPDPGSTRSSRPTSTRC